MIGTSTSTTELLEQGTLHAQEGDDEAAAKCFLAAAEAEPMMLVPHLHAGIVLERLQRHNEAVAQLSTACALDPATQGTAHTELARALINAAVPLVSEPHTQDDPRSAARAAIRLCKQATAHEPSSVAFFNLGVAYNKLGKTERAISSYRVALLLDPKMATAFTNLGVCFKQLNNVSAALSCYEKAIELDPQAVALNNAAIIVLMLGKAADAQALLLQAIQQNPKFAQAYSNMGVVLRDMGRIEEALSWYERALEVDSTFEEAHHNLLFLLNSLEIDPSLVFQRHLQWGASFSSKHLRVDLHSAPCLDGRIRVGYISGDFFTHSVSYFISGVLEQHDKQRFSIFCYSNVDGSNVDAMTLRLQSQHQWRTVTGLSTREAAEMIAADGLDILVDLSGHTAGNRLDVMASKPARVQATWLGYANITGLPTIDFRLVDSITDPPGQQLEPPLGAEKLVRLPGCFLSYSPPSATGVSFDESPFLENGGAITFGSFNMLNKVGQATIACWSAILLAVPGSRLLLKSRALACAKTRALLWKAFVSHGLADAQLRVVLLPMTATVEQHLAAYGQIDIALDTFPYSGTTTTCEALYMGRPVITMRGITHASNVSASLLHQVRLDRFVASNAIEYTSKAVALARDTVQLRDLHMTLRITTVSSQLCDAKSFTRNLEKLFVSFISP